MESLDKLKTDVDDLVSLISALPTSKLTDRLLIGCTMLYQRCNDIELEHMDECSDAHSAGYDVGYQSAAQEALLDTEATIPESKL